MAEGYYKPCPELTECNRLIEEYFRKGFYKECFEGHLRLAEEGYPLAECQVGYFYMEGLGVEKDPSKAFYWTERGALHGDRDAQCNLGEFYRDGFGTERNLAKAREWLQKAAEQGNDCASGELAALRVRIAVLVSGGGTNLQALLDAERSGALHSGEIALVVSNRSAAYALERAKNANVPAVFLSKKENGGTQEGFEAALTSLLEEYRIDLIVLAGYMSILTGDFTARWPRRIINIHPALIPSFCGKGFYGLRVHEAALQRGVKVTGATVHFVNEIPDGGEILAQKAVCIQDGDTPETLQRRVMEEAEWVLLPETVERVCHTILEGNI